MYENLFFFFFNIVICYNTTMLANLPVYKSVLNYSFGFTCVNKTRFPSFKYKSKNKISIIESLSQNLVTENR